MDQTSKEQRRQSLVNSEKLVAILDSLQQSLSTQISVADLNCIAFNSIRICFHIMDSYGLEFPNQKRILYLTEIDSRNSNTVRELALYCIQIVKDFFVLDITPKVSTIVGEDENVF